MKALVGTFNHEKTLVGAFSVIVQLQSSQLVFAPLDEVVQEAAVAHAADEEEHGEPQRRHRARHHQQLVPRVQVTQHRVQRADLPQ